ncbi:caspase family protein [Paraburkholderia strydomiana]|uniref:caspase family protein n=1 Tax=Paraburkholderia strydomiana TaxID=1245417 RepID=UPI0038B86A6E
MRFPVSYLFVILFMYHGLALPNAGQPILIPNSGRVDAEFVAASASGNFVAAATQSGIVDVWSLKSGRRIRSIEAGRFVKALAIAQEGTKVAVLSTDSLAVLDVTTGQIVKEFKQRPDSKFDYVSYGGQTLFATWGAGLSSFNIVDGSRAEIVRLRDDDSIAVGTDGLAEVTSTNENSIELRGAINAKLPIAAIRWSRAAPQSARLVVAGARGATLWDLNRQTPIANYPWIRSHAPEDSQAVFSTDGQTLLLPNGESLQVIDAMTGKVRTVIESNTRLNTYLPTNNFGPLVIAAENMPLAVRDSMSGHILMNMGATVPVRPRVRVISGTKLLISDETGGAVIWDISSGLYQKLAKDRGITFVASSTTGDSVAWVENTGDVYYLGSRSKNIVKRIGKLAHRPSGESDCVLALSPAGELVFIISDYDVLKIDAVTGRASTLITVKPQPTCLASAPDGKLLVAPLYGGPILANTAKDNQVFNFSDKKLQRIYDFSDISVNKEAILFVSHNSFAVASDLKVERAWFTMVQKGAQRGVLLGPTVEAAISDYNGNIEVWNIRTKARLSRWIAHSGWISSLAAMSDGKVLVSSGDDGQIKLWTAESGNLLATLLPLKTGGWMVATPDGRFDSSDVDTMNAVAWGMPDDPMRPLAPEIFLRDFFQPGLLPSIWDCIVSSGSGADCSVHDRVVRPLTTLNRIQPDISIASIVPGNSPHEVNVKVQVASTSDVSQPNGKTQTDVYDVRLFRSGQLVGRWPNGEDSSDEITAWRARTHVPMPDNSKKVTLPFNVSLAERDAGKSIVFTAYAFNEDRVKSGVANATYVVPSDKRVHKSRAYVLSIGVDSYEAPERNLRFAAADAKAMVAALSTLQGYDVIPLTLISHGNDPRAWQATKANIREVLRRLSPDATRSRSSASTDMWQALVSGLEGVMQRFIAKSNMSNSLSKVQGAEYLSQVTPDDLLILTFSGHGYTQLNGDFYLLPSDSGTDRSVTTASLSKFISSQELSEWLRPIDAGQIVLVIDACHSALSVAQPGFKPGPMGDRGLGQLAYDKAMQILAASHGVALESAQVEHGLLTYALVHDALMVSADGVRAADLNGDGKVTLAEWLHYGEQHTLRLDDDILGGKKGVVYIGRDSTNDPRFRELAIRKVQKPVLFDFARPTAVDPFFK